MPSNYAVFPQSIVTATVVATAAKTTYNDAANAVALFTAGLSGSEVVGLSAIPRATVTATQLQLYLSRDGGVTLHLLTTELLPAYTMAQTTKATPVAFAHPAGNGNLISETNPLRLAPSDKLYVGIGVALAGGVVFALQSRDL